MDSVPASEVKDELKANALRRDALQAKLAAADEPPPLLHPEMARIYRTKVTELATALQQPESRAEATEALRGLVDAIVLTPAATGTRHRAEGQPGCDARSDHKEKAVGRQSQATRFLCEVMPS